MKTTLSAIITMGLLLLIPMPAVAQNTVTFSYDASGNRTGRQIAVSSVKERRDETTGIEAAEEDGLESRVRITADTGAETVSAVIDGYSPAEKGTVRLFTTSGTLLRETAITSEVTTIALNPYPSGVYILSVTLGTQQHGWKISVR